MRIRYHRVRKRIFPVTGIAASFADREVRPDQFTSAVKGVVFADGWFGFNQGSLHRLFRMCGPGRQALTAARNPDALGSYFFWMQRRFPRFLGFNNTQALRSQHENLPANSLKLSG